MVISNQTIPDSHKETSAQPACHNILHVTCGVIRLVKLAPTPTPTPNPHISLTSNKLPLIHFLYQKAQAN